MFIFWVFAQSGMKICPKTNKVPNSWVLGFALVLPVSIWETLCLQVVGLLG